MRAAVQLWSEILLQIRCRCCNSASPIQFMIAGRGRLRGSGYGTPRRSRGPRFRLPAFGRWLIMQSPHLSRRDDAHAKPLAEPATRYAARDAAPYADDPPLRGARLG